MEHRHRHRRANTALGTNTLVSNLASYNTAVGGQALYSNAEGTSNTAIGMNALFSNVSGSYNVATGYNALTAHSSGIWNTAMGTAALQSLTTGEWNVAVGGQALSAVSNESYNTAVGTNALLNNTAGQNTAVGNSALSANTTGGYNTGIGFDALRNNQSSQYNTAVGHAALQYAIGGSNTALGYLTGGNATLGSFNLFLGYGAGFNVVGGSNNIHIGAYGKAADTGTIRIGFANPGAYTQTYIDAIHGATSSGGVGVLVNSEGRLGTLTSSARFKDDIASLGDVSARVQALRPVRFVYKPGVDDGSRVPQYGLIAEEVAAVIPDLVVRDEHGEAQTVRYHFLPPLLLAEVQRLERERQTQATESAAQALRLDA